MADATIVVPVPGPLTVVMSWGPVQAKVITPPASVKPKTSRRKVRTK